MIGMFLTEYGLDEPALNKLYKGVYKLLDLITFLLLVAKKIELGILKMVVQL